MNVYQPYERRTDRTLAPVAMTETDTAVASEERSRLATHGDPSLAPQSPARKSGAGGPGVAWVRPTELATRVSASLTGRAIDLEVALVRRVRRVPASATRAMYAALPRPDAHRQQQGAGPAAAPVVPAPIAERGL